MKVKDTPMLLFIIFTLIYSTIGDPSSKVWSGLYFTVNYSIMLSLFLKEKNKINKITGVSLAITMYIVIVLRYIFNLDYDRYYSIIPFLITVFWVYKKEVKK